MLTLATILFLGAAMFVGGLTLSVALIVLIPVIIDISIALWIVKKVFKRNGKGKASKK